MHLMQLPSLQAPVDSPAANAQVKQLSPAHNGMLPSRKLSDRTIPFPSR